MRTENFGKMYIDLNWSIITTDYDYIADIVGEKDYELLTKTGYGTVQLSPRKEDRFGRIDIHQDGSIAWEFWTEWNEKYALAETILWEHTGREDFSDDDVERMADDIQQTIEMIEMVEGNFLMNQMGAVTQGSHPEWDLSVLEESENELLALNKANWSLVLNATRDCAMNIAKEKCS